MFRGTTEPADSSSAVALPIVVWNFVSPAAPPPPQTVRTGGYPGGHNGSQVQPAQRHWRRQGMEETLIIENYIWNGYM